MVDVAAMTAAELLNIALESIFYHLRLILSFTPSYINLSYIMISIIMIDDFNCNMAIVLSRRKERIENAYGEAQKRLVVSDDKGYIGFCSMMTRSGIRKVKEQDAIN